MSAVNDPRGGAEHSLNKILWRCRRGTRELEHILLGFAKQHYLQLDPTMQSRFDQLLEVQDPLLTDWLCNNHQVVEPFCGIVHKILSKKC